MNGNPAEDMDAQWRQFIVEDVEDDDLPPRASGWWSGKE